MSCRQCGLKHGVAARLRQRLWRYGGWLLVVWLVGIGSSASAQVSDAASGLQLGPGDLITVEVFGRPELSAETYVAASGSLSLPLIGQVEVAGLSPAAAAARIEDAYRRGEFLVSPQVTVRLAEFRSQQISVLGEVKNPGRFPVESRTTVFDVLADAGGILDMGSFVVTVIRPQPDGQMERFTLDLKSLERGDVQPSLFTLRGGDSVFVPRAERFYIVGEVENPDAYRLEPEMTVLQAIAVAGGVTDRGSRRRIAIKRKQADGQTVEFDAPADAKVLPDDVIRVKERIF